MRTRCLPYLGALLMVVAGCAAPSLMPPSQAAAVKSRERALAAHADAIHAAIKGSGQTGALAYLEGGDGRLVVLPGDSPIDAWMRFNASPGHAASRGAVPPVVTYVHRADIAAAPEAIDLSALEQQQALRTSVVSLQTELGTAHQLIEDRLGAVQRELRETVETTQREADATQAAVRADVQRALSALGDDLASVRRLLLQTAQLGWLNHELAVDNANGVRKVASASQELAASSARLEDTIRQLSDTLAGQLKELAARLDNIQGKVTSLK
jgi:hypothetical protein